MLHVQVSADLGALPLPQRDLLKLLGKAQLVCELEQVSHGVSPRGQDKDEGGGVAGVQEGSRQIEGRRLCKLCPKMLSNKALNSQGYLRPATTLVFLVGMLHTCLVRYSCGGQQMDQSSRPVDKQQLLRAQQVLGACMKGGSRLLIFMFGTRWCT